MASDAAVETTKPQREFSVAEGLAYMMGAIGIQLMTVTVMQWSMYFYNPPQGSGRVIFLSLGLATAMMFVGRAFDAVSDPIVGWWSDKTKSRWGRRRPFIIFGSIPLAIIFILFWLPPVHGASIYNFIWGCFFASAFYWAITIVLVPILALHPEIAVTTVGRVKLGVYFGVGMILGLILGFLYGMLYEAIGMTTTAIIYSVAGLICFQITGWVIKERHREEDTEKKSLSDMFKDMASTLKNKPFLIFLAAETIFALAIAVIGLVLVDFNAVILKKGEGFVTILMLPYLLVCFPLLFFVEATVERWNKKIAYAAGILGFALIFPLFWVIGMLPDKSVCVIPFMNPPVCADIKVVLILITIAFAAAPQAIKYVMPGPMIGEIADYDEKVFSGKRREAIYSGAVGFAIKSATTLSIFVRWAVYQPLGGYSVDNPTPVLLIGPVVAVIAFIGFLIFLKYPILHVVKGEEE